MAQATKTTGAEQVRWDLTDLFQSPTDPGIEETLAEAHQRAEREGGGPEYPSGFATAAWTRLFEELCARIRVALDGRRVPLDEALVRLREANRKVRREASAAITAALDEDGRTRGYIFNVILGEKAIDDRLRHFPTWISSRNLANETSDEAVQALIEAVTGRYDVCVRYYRVKKKLL